MGERVGKGWADRTVIHRRAGSQEDQALVQEWLVGPTGGPELYIVANAKLVLRTRLRNGRGSCSALPSRQGHSDQAGLSRPGNTCKIQDDCWTGSDPFQML
jgi:hypothetical protein